MFVTIVIIVLFIALATTKKTINSSAEYKGKKGEEHVMHLLENLSTDEYVSYNNVVYKTAYGTTQIDHIVVSKYAVFLIETKNYIGEIYGNDDRQEWKQIIKTDVTYYKKLWKVYTYITKNTLYNPIRQSLGHVTQVSRLLSNIPHIQIVPIVVFSDDADISNVTSQYHVINWNQLIPCIQSYTECVMTESDVRKVRILLSDNNVRETTDNNTHKQNVEKARAIANNKISEGICPRCGKPLVLRQGKYGNFYGCIGYPKCKFTIDA